MFLWRKRWLEVKCFGLDELEDGDDGSDGSDRELWLDCVVA